RGARQALIDEIGIHDQTGGREVVRDGPLVSHIGRDQHEFVRLQIQRLPAPQPKSRGLIPLPQEVFRRPAWSGSAVLQVQGWHVGRPMVLTEGLNNKGSRVAVRDGGTDGPEAVGQIGFAERAHLSHCVRPLFNGSAVGPGPIDWAWSHRTPVKQGADAMTQMSTFSEANLTDRFRSISAAISDGYSAPFVVQPLGEHHRPADMPSLYLENRTPRPRRAPKYFLWQGDQASRLWLRGREPLDLQPNEFVLITSDMANEWTVPHDFTTTCLIMDSDLVDECLPRAA